MMAEWKLFTDVLPEPREQLRGRDWMNLAAQPGFAQRSAMVAGLVRMACILLPVASITDLGCGDGALLAQLADLPQAKWGYELGAADVAYGQAQGLDVRQADILTDDLEYGDLLIATEVAEHLENPAGFISALPGHLLILSSPSLETGEWHNSIHAWAWDLDGYRELAERSGWQVAYQTDCDGGSNTFAGVTGRQRFQAILAVR